MKILRLLFAEIAVNQWKEYGQRPQFTSRDLGSTQQTRGADSGLQVGNRMFALQANQTDPANPWTSALL
jgi:hypothetical protein